MRNHKRFYTFIVASHADGKMLRVSLPYPVLCAIAFLALIGVVAAGAAAYHYGRMLLKVSDYDHLLAQNDSFRSENHQFRIQTAQLAERIDLLETMATKLKTMSGMNSSKEVGGAGGFSPESFGRPRPASSGDLPAIEGYNRSVNGLEAEYRDIGITLSEKIFVQSAKPNLLPVLGYVTGGLGPREDPFNGSVTEHHTGLDISAPYGTPVHAPADGLVIYAGQREGYGNIVVIDHKFGYVTRYGHLSKMSVEVGQHVSRSEVIGFVGTSGRTTGPHLHYELWWNNRSINPMKWLAQNQ